MQTRKRHRAYPAPLLVQRRIRARVRAARSFLPRARRFLVLLGVLGSTLLMASLVVVGKLYASVTAGLPPVETVPAMLDPQSGDFFTPTRFYDRSGQHVLYTLENPGAARKYLSVDPGQPEHISPWLTQVVVALEEPGFWSNPGFPLRHLTRPEPQTIAERLADSLLLAAEPPSPTRALRMHLLAAQLTTRYGRAQVLEWYLNSAYFGHLAYGAAEAASLYLGRPAGSLGLAEAALLGSLLDTPALNPLDAPEAAIDRATETLDRLAASGLFAPKDIQAARASQPTLANPGQPPTPPEFIRYALQQLEEAIPPARLERGGLRVITTLDAGLQEQALCTLEVQLGRLEAPDTAGKPPPDTCPAAFLLPTRASGNAVTPGHAGDLLGSILVVNPATAEILAWTGQRSALGPAVAPVQYRAGSLLTPFVAAAAFMRGFSPASLVWDVPPDGPDERVPGSSTNPDGAYHGPVHLRIALANDYLAPIVRLAEATGYENTWLLAGMLGFQDLERDQVVAYLEAGTAPVTILQVAQAYSVFANTGVQAGFPGSETNSLQPVAVLRVDDIFGRSVYAPGAAQQRALLSQGLAYLVHDILSDPIARRPSLGRPNALEIGRPAGAKSGQLSDAHQAWTVGYTPHTLAVVWIGRPDSAAGESGLAVTPAMTAGAWHAMIQYAEQEQPAAEWKTPADVVERAVCSPSGQLPTAACPVQVNELFLTGSEPVVADTLYQVVAVNRETGKLATVFTPLEDVEEKVFFIPPPEYQAWAAANGYPQPPNDYDLIQPQQPPPGVEISLPLPFSYVSGVVNVQGTAGGDDFVAYRVQVGQGLNPRSWLQLGEESQQPAQNHLLAEWDTAGLEGLYVIRLTVLRTRNRLESHVIQVSVDNTPPLVSIDTPADGASLVHRAGQSFLFLVSASDAIGIAEVRWFLDGQPAGTGSQAPFYLQAQAKPGEHTLQVQAIDLAGNTARSPLVTFTIVNP